MPGPMVTGGGLTEPMFGFQAIGSSLPKLIIFMCLDTGIMEERLGSMYEEGGADPTLR